MSEEWRIIDGFPAYAVSSLGDVKRIVESRSGNLPKQLRPWISREGYAIVTLFNGGKGKRMQVGRLVCRAFHGPAPTPEHQVAHNDGNPGNNTASNLRWATRAENMADCLIHGTRAMGLRHGRHTKPERNPRGERHGGSKLTEEAVREIRRHPKVPGSGVALAKRYGVTPTAICLIRANKNWKHV